MKKRKKFNKRYLEAAKDGFETLLANDALEAVIQENGMLCTCIDDSGYCGAVVAIPTFRSKDNTFAFYILANTISQEVAVSENVGIPAPIITTKYDNPELYARIDTYAQVHMHDTPTNNIA